MTFLSIVIVLLFLQLWGSGEPLQKDTWFWRWVDKLNTLDAIKQIPVGVTLFAVGIPVLGVLIISVLCADLWYGTLALLINVPVLLFTLGRGDFSQHVAAYLNAWRRGDLEAAYFEAAYFRGECHPSEAQSWQQLHYEVFRGVAYRGFERLFAPLFWFFVLGPAGALGYRLLYLIRDHQCELDYSEHGLTQEASHALNNVDSVIYLLEWLPVRILSFSMSLAGNFTGSFQWWQEYLLDCNFSTDKILEKSAAAAIGVKGGLIDESEDLRRQLTECAWEIESLVSLLSRCLVVWIVAFALIILVG